MSYAVSAAGPIFTDGRHALAGYQPSKSCITGIGGKAIEGEVAIMTAMREFIEEIYCCAAPDLLVAQLAVAVSPQRRFIVAGDYQLLEYSFADLEVMLTLVASAELESPAYSRMPCTLIELILWRAVPEGSEVGVLALVPLGCIIGAEFVADGALILATK